MPYPVKMRERALQALRNGHTKAQVREMFGLGINTLRDWEKLESETGSLEDRPPERTAYKIDREKLLAYYRKNPYSTNAETAVVFQCSVSGIRSAKKVLGITRKKTQSNMLNEMSKSEKNSLPK
jgi:transposase